MSFSKLEKWSTLIQRTYCEREHWWASLKQTLVRAATEHQFYHKWAVLNDGTSSGIKGYLKLDISVIAKGDFIRTIKTADNDKEDDIETNLLLPAGITERTMARYMFGTFTYICIFFDLLDTLDLQLAK